MARIEYLTGDASNPQADGRKIIAHHCNDRGAWGKGFALGAIRLVQVTPNTWVANMIGQHGVRTRRDTDPPIRYEAVRLCLRHLAGHAHELAASIHLPRIGCGLAGGQIRCPGDFVARTACRHHLRYEPRRTVEPGWCVGAAGLSRAGRAERGARLVEAIRAQSAPVRWGGW
jgi:O-acetyl-ADP-ribose deacetylase (regulator of RNase III)